jgi:hypothetical protein
MLVQKRFPMFQLEQRRFSGTAAICEEVFQREHLDAERGNCRQTDLGETSVEMFPLERGPAL